ncbi:hypothetical protein H4R33_001052 [Dimargaris cristalligena]|nr:hypothetical protein H4R33_001052 [Dimargaris cristalligena]
MQIKALITLFAIAISGTQAGPEAVLQRPIEILGPGIHQESAVLQRSDSPDARYNHTVPLRRDSATFTNSPGDEIDQAKCVALINKVRADVGVEPVNYDPKLEIMALQHTQWINAANNLTHWDPDGDLFMRLRLLGGNCNFVGECIGLGYGNEEEVVEGWKNSPHHYEILISPYPKYMACARVGNWWTLDVAAYYYFVEATGVLLTNK